MIKTLCKPCAVKLMGTAKEVKQLKTATSKITCDGCGCRRFGTTYEVTSRVCRPRKNG